MKRKIALLLAPALLTGCADNAKTLVETAEQAATATTIITELTVATSATKAETPVTSLTTAASTVKENIPEPQYILEFNAYLDEHYEKAEYYEVNGAVTARASTGFCKTADTYEELSNEAESIAENADIRLVTAGDSLADNLVVEAAFCRYAREDGVIFSEMMRLGGELTLTGIIRRLPETDVLDFMQKGDLVFYPFPESLAGLPISFSYRAYNALEITWDEENDSYTGWDTTAIFVGNNETKDFPYRGGFNESNDVSEVSMEYNSVLDSCLDDTEYYIAELTFDKLLIQQAEAPKTGCYFSFGNIAEVINVEPYEKDDGE